MHSMFVDYIYVCTWISAYKRCGKGTEPPHTDKPKSAKGDYKEEKGLKAGVYSHIL